MADRLNQYIIPEDEISLKEMILTLQKWVRYLCTKWIIILIGTMIGGGLGLVYSLHKKPIYTAILTFASEENNSGGALAYYNGLASQLGIDLGGTSSIFSGDNIVELMKSRLMICNALLSGIKVQGREQSLADYYTDFNHLSNVIIKPGKASGNIIFRVNSNSDSLSYIQDSLMDALYHRIVSENLKIEKVDVKLNIIKVSCRSSNELFSKYFTEALVKNVSDFYVRTKTKKSTANVEILQFRVDSVRKAYNEALYGTAVSTDQNLNPARAVVSVPRIRSQTETQILGAEYAELVKNLEIAKITLLQETPLIQVIDKPTLPLEKTQISKLKGALLGIIPFCFIVILLLILKEKYRRLMFVK